MLIEKGKQKRGNENKPGKKKKEKERGKHQGIGWLMREQKKNDINFSTERGYITNRNGEMGEKARRTGAWVYKRNKEKELLKRHKGIYYDKRQEAKRLHTVNGGETGHSNREIKGVKDK